MDQPSPTKFELLVYARSWGGAHEWHPTLSSESSDIVSSFLNLLSSRLEKNVFPVKNDFVQRQETFLQNWDHCFNNLQLVQVHKFHILTNSRISLKAHQKTWEFHPLRPPAWSNSSYWITTPDPSSLITSRPSSCWSLLWTALYI